MRNFLSRHSLTISNNHIELNFDEHCMQLFDIKHSLATTNSLDDESSLNHSGLAFAMNKTSLLVIYLRKIYHNKVGQRKIHDASPTGTKFWPNKVPSVSTDRASFADRFYLPLIHFLLRFLVIMQKEFAQQFDSRDFGNVSWCAKIFSFFFWLNSSNAINEKSYDDEAANISQTKFSSRCRKLNAIVIEIIFGQLMRLIFWTKLLSSSLANLTNNKNTDERLTEILFLQFLPLYPLVEKWKPFFESRIKEIDSMMDRVMAALKEATFVPIRGTIGQVVLVAITSEMTSKISVDDTKVSLETLCDSVKNEN